MTQCVLLTAFKPFGLKGTISRTNSSELVGNQVHRRIRSEIDYHVLPVDATASLILEQLLQTEPRGAVLMGEDISEFGLVRIEPRAFDPRRQVGLVRLPGAASTGSDFAQTLARRLPAAGVTCRQAIGTYYCNEIYFHALQWATAHKRPVVFLHLGLFGDVNAKADYVCRVIQFMASGGA